MAPRRFHSPAAAAAASLIIILLLSSVATSQSQFPNTETHTFGPFSDNDVGKIYLLSIASVTNGVIQLTPPSSIPLPFLFLPHSGRMFLTKPFKLWEDNPNGRLASFSTSFLFTVSRVGNFTPGGEGLAFLISPSLSITLSSCCQYLGLTNPSTDGDAANQMVAIELDTVKQEEFDPDDNHIGLDIHSVRSNVTVSLSQFGFRIDSGDYFVVWVEYDGVKKVIDVYMALQPDKDAPIVEKPTKAVLSSGVDLRGLVNQVSYFGFSASNSHRYESHTILKWNLSVEVLGKNSLNIGLGVSVWAPLLVLFVVGVISGVVYYYLRKKTTRVSDSDYKLLSTIERLPGTPREFSFRELKKATNNFDDKHKLGQGGYGVVYKGMLPKENLEVAVKKFSRDSMKSIDDFLAELTIINRLRHKNLVRLIGWCHKNGVLLLVYDYMPNGSLDKHIFFEDGTGRTPLSWHLRYKIILGVVSALHYLHNEYDQKVVHRDLKASNIMLDSDFNARLGDFGLARALENEKTFYADLKGVLGTMGYIAPECFHTGKATRASDVYGFGAVLLEVVCGKRPWTEIEGYHFLVDWVWHLHHEGRILEAVDPRLGNVYVAEEAEGILKLGLACSHPFASERPKMQAIVQIMSGSMSVPHVPLLKPAFVWSTVVDAGCSKYDSKTIATLEYTPINTDCFAR